jgi:AsmA protein
MKRLLIILAVLVLVVVLAGAGALLLVDANHFRPQIQATLSDALGRPVTLGKLHVSVFSGSLDADDIRIGDDPAFGKEPFVSAHSLDVGVRLWPLIVHRELHVTSLTLDAPSVRLVQNRAGKWNFSSFAAGDVHTATTGTASDTPALQVDALRIRNGRIVLKRAVGGTRTYDKVQLSADDVGTHQAFPFTMSAVVAGGGQLKLEGKIGPWDAGNAVQTPLTAHLTMNDIGLVRAGLVEHGDGISSVIDVDSQIQSKSGILHSKGRIDANKLQLVASGSPAPKPIRLDYQADYRLTSSTGSIRHTRLGTGKASLAVSGSFDGRGQVMRVNLSIAGQKLPVDDLQPLLPAFGVVLPKDSRLSGGTLGMKLRARGPLDALVITGPVTLDNTTLAGYSLGDKLGGALSLAGISAPRDTRIEHAEASLRIAPAGIRANPAKADIKGLGNMSGKGTMATSGALDFDMLVKLDKNLASSAASGKLLSGSKAGRMIGGLLGGTSDSGIGVHVGGTASDPKFRIDPSAAASLLRSGFAGSSTPSSSKTTTTNKRDTTRDAISNLLKNALNKKDKQN